MDTSRQEGLQEGLTRGREEGLQEGLARGREEERFLSLQRQRSLLIKQLSRKLGEIPNTVQTSINQLSPESLNDLGEELFDFSTMDDLIAWLSNK